MTDPQRATEELLAEKPAAEDHLREMVRVDADGPWNFDDVAVDSGTFGEIVSRGIVETNGDDYRLADRDAVRAALDGESTAVEEESVSAPDLTLEPGSWFSGWSIEWKHAGALGLGLTLVVVLRILLIGSVFRNGDVVLAGNDPWGFRYWVEFLLAQEVHPLNLDAVSELLGAGISADYLYVIFLWWLAAAAGGTPEAAGLVLAWTPVLLAVLTAAVVYVIALRLTADRRIGLASVVMLAFTPIHAYRTMIGFADHHAFDYFLLAVGALGLVLIATEQVRREIQIGGRTVSIPASRTAWLGAATLGVGVSAQVLAWLGSPLLLPPLVGYAAYQAFWAVREGRSPIGENTAFLAGLAFAGILGYLPFALWGWPSLFWALSPTFLFTVIIGVFAAGEVSHRSALSPRASLGLIAISGAVVGVGLSTLPVVSSTLSEGLSYFRRTGESNIAETLSLFGEEVGSLFGPVLFFGLLLFLALPYLGIALWRATREHHPEWIAVGVYALYFILLATVQLRFAGELAVFTAIFAGLGFVQLAARIDLISSSTAFAEDRPAREGRRLGEARRDRSFTLPDVSTGTYLVVFLLLVTSLSLVQIPVKQTQLAIDDETYRTASWMSSYADKQDYPSSKRYVFSSWGRNRVYNHFVSGNSRSYAFAKDHYGEFLSANDSQEWYGQLRGRTAFIVTQPYASVPKHSIQAQLHRRYGSVSEDGGDAAKHYRAVYATENGQRKVFTLVRGATVTGRSSDGTLSTQVSIPGAEFTYRQRVETTRNGWFVTTVPYSGRYTVQEDTVRVSERAVTESKTIKTIDANGSSYYPFDEGTGRIAFDVFSADHGRIGGATRVKNGVEGAGLSFDADRDNVTITRAAPNRFTVSLWVKPSALDTSPENDYRHLLLSKNGFFIILEENGAVSFRIPGVDTNGLFAGSVPVDRWTHVAAAYNGTHRLIYIDGERVGAKPTDTGSVDWKGELWVGGNAESHGFRGEIDELRIYDRSLPVGRIRQLANRSTLL